MNEVNALIAKAIDLGLKIEVSGIHYNSTLD